MNLDEIREALFQAMDDQQAADEAAANEAYKVNQQKLMYNNDARGTLYSGQPTWERAQLATTNVANIADIQQKALAKKISVWEKIASTMDQINSYNKAAAAMAKAGTSGTSSSAGATQSFQDLYNEIYGGN